MRLLHRLLPLRLTLLLTGIILSMSHISLAFEPDTNILIGEVPKVIWEDDFRQTQDQWQHRDKETILYLRKGYLRFASLSENPRWIQRAAPLRRLDNFELTSRFRLIHNVYQQNGGLVFGGNQLSHGYEFVHDGAGQYLLRARHGSEHKTLAQWEGPMIHSQEFAQFVIRQLNRKWHFEVNGRVVGSCQSLPLYGYEVGYVADGRVALEADYINLSAPESPDPQGPLVALTEPVVRSNETLLCEKPFQTIKGRIDGNARLARFTINGEAISISSQGVFSTTLKLYEGANRITIHAQDQQGREFEQSFVLLHQPPVVIQPVSYQQKPTVYPKRPTTVSARPQKGKNFLLVIGINQYNHWQPLHNAVKDCEDLITTLVRHYRFQPEHIIRVMDHEATRERILETLEQLQERISPEDNLLIYYAGHGYYDAQAELGYWVPVDARSSKIPDYIRNSTIHDYVRTIDSRNTLLIADACYAGSLFAQYRGEIQQGAKSRWAFTSGDIEKVWDGRPGENSPFAYHLLSCLKENQRQVMPANDLIYQVTDRVHRQTTQSPQGSPLRQAGDKGGVFLFIKR